MKHQKHAKLTRPNYGYFGRNEWAIIGTPCGKIQELAYALVENLKGACQVTYVDADHKHGDEANEKTTKTNAIEHGAYLEYTDKITHHRFDTHAQLDSYQYRQYFNEADLVLVNGNHFQAKQQIVVIDPKKEASLQRKLDRLTDVALFLLVDGQMDIYPFLKDHISDWENIPQLALTDIVGITDFIQQQMETTQPPLYGLVLAGGKSTRMGVDKGLIDYHGKPQRSYIADMLGKVCEQVFISCRADQVAEIDKNYMALPDTFEGLGPYGAILSAFRQYPNHAWLVIACDLPLMSLETLQLLKTERNISTIATAFNSPQNEFPEPLITIWEPKSYPVLLQFLAQGYSCPRKVLINSNVELLDAPNAAKVLMNVNIPEERDALLKEK